MVRSLVGIAVISTLAALALGSIATAGIYRWVDESGEKHLVSDLGEVPEQYRDAALAESEKRNDGHGSVNFIESTSPSGQASGDEAAPAAAASPQPTTGNSMPGGQPESWWRHQSLQLQRNVSDAHNALKLAQDNGDDDDGVTVVGRPGRGAGSRRAVRRGAGGDGDYTEYSYERDLDQLQADVDDAERTFRDFEDEARRAGVPNGWLRR